MKKKILIFIFVLCMCIGAIGGIYCYNKLNKTTYCLNLPAIENVSIINLKQNAKGMSTSDFEEIKDIINVLNGVKRVTKQESIQDAPVNVENEIKIDFKFKEGGTSTVFVYERNNKYYIEQPYNGIYRIAPDEYNSIEKYIRNSNENNMTTAPYIPDGMDMSNQNNIETPSEEKEYNRSPENVIIEVMEDTITNTGLSIIITDNNEDYYGWGVDFKVEKKIEDGWKCLEPISGELSWIEIAYVPNENNQIAQKLDIEKYYGKLTSGTYRIVKLVYDNGYIELYSNEFEIK